MAEGGTTNSVKRLKSKLLSTRYQSILDISPASSSQSTLTRLGNFAGSDCEILDENIIVSV